MHWPWPEQGVMSLLRICVHSSMSCVQLTPFQPLAQLHL
jgi:hypothetical protein